MIDPLLEVAFNSLPDRVKEQVAAGNPVAERRLLRAWQVLKAGEPNLQPADVTTTENPPTQPGDQLVPGARDAPMPAPRGDTAQTVTPLISKQVG